MGDDASRAMYQRQKVQDELIDTELRYLEKMRGFEALVVRRAQQMLSSADFDTIFGFLPDILAVSQQYCGRLCGTGRLDMLERLGIVHARQRLVAFAMVLHPRLGAGSLVQQLGADLVGRIGEQLLHDELSTSIFASYCEHYLCARSVYAFSRYATRLESALQALRAVRASETRLRSRKALTCFPEKRRALIRPTDCEAVFGVAFAMSEVQQAPAESFLIIPIQVFCRHRLFFGELLRYAQTSS